MASLNETKLDIEELSNLTKVATRPRVKDFLNKEINRLTSVLENLNVDITTKNIGSTAQKPVPKLSSTPGKYYSDITNYAWDQSDKFIKIYITIRGASISKESVTCNFDKHSYLLKIENVADKNYRHNITNLFDAIRPTESSFRVKSDTVVLSLRKDHESKTWPNVTKGQTKDKKTPKFDDKKDPNESLMNLMKQMYEDGDDEMKRTIAKSFAESRNKTGGGDIGAGMDM